MNEQRFTMKSGTHDDDVIEEQGEFKAHQTYIRFQRDEDEDKVKVTLTFIGGGISKENRDEALAIISMAALQHLLDEFGVTDVTMIHEGGKVERIDLSEEDQP